MGYCYVGRVDRYKLTIVSIIVAALCFVSFIEGARQGRSQMKAEIVYAFEVRPYVTLGGMKIQSPPRQKKARVAMQFNCAVRCHTAIERN